MKINDNCEAFDWAWALYHWLNLWHDGIHCDKYEALCRLCEDYKLANVPDIDFNNNDCDEYDMAVIYYHDLDQENWAKHFDKFCTYMEEEWDNEAC